MIQHYCIRFLTITLSYLLIISMFSSCVPHKKILLLGEQVDSTLVAGNIRLKPQEIKIQLDDILHIQVSSLQEEVAAPFNIMQAQQQGGGGGQPLPQGYLVDTFGDIDYPVLGKIKLQGLTRVEAKELLLERLREYLVAPVVDVRFMNYRITILGEVNQPGTYVFNNEVVTFFEVLSRAGDFGQYANREDVLIVRRNSGEVRSKRLNLLTPEIFESEYFYLAQNDVIYVEPLKIKTAAIDSAVSRNISIVSGIISLWFLISSLRQ